MKFPLSHEQISHLDPSGMLSLLTSFPDQLDEAVEIMHQVRLSVK